MNGIDVNTFVNLLQILVIVGGAIWFMSHQNSQMQSLIDTIINERSANSKKFDEIEEQLEKLVNATVQLARQEERLNAFDMRVSEISNRVMSLCDKREAMSSHISSTSKRRRSS